VYHYSNEGVCSWYDFARTIIELTGSDCEVVPIRSEDYPTPAPRPAYSVMDKGKIKHDFKIHIPWWKESLALCLKNMQKQN
jgi:dTDP-4-dehydrorhamnose reductase